MKKTIFLFLLLGLTFSCFEEQVPAKYFIGTVWGATESEGVYGEDNKLEHVYLNSHTLTLSESAFTHVIYRKEAGSIGYIDKDTVELGGTYVLHYPKITLKYPGVERNGTIEFETLSLPLAEKNRTLEFIIRRTPAGKN